MSVITRLEYKGYIGKAEFDDEAKIIYGEVVNIKHDVITFQARRSAKLRKSFEESVDDYLEWCKELGQKPEKPIVEKPAREKRRRDG